MARNFGGGGGGGDVTAHEAASDPHPTYETSAEAAAKVSAHEADTTSIHGIADTSVLATASSVATAVSNHEADTTSVHGVSDTSALLTTAHTGAADPHTGYVLESLLDAKGDIIVASAADTAARLAAGTNGQVLQAASGETTGLKWATEPLVGSFPQTVDGRSCSSAAATTANRACYMLVTEGPVVSISNLVIFVGTSSGNISVAVYDSTGSGRSRLPNNRLATSGTVACPSGSAEATIALGGSVTVIPFETWFCITVDNGTATFGRLSAAFNAALCAGLSVFQASAHPAPASAASLSTHATSYWLAGT